MLQCLPTTFSGEANNAATSNSSHGHGQTHYFGAHYCPPHMTPHGGNKHQNHSQNHNNKSRGGAGGGGPFTAVPTPVADHYRHAAGANNNSNSNSNGGGGANTSGAITAAPYEAHMARIREYLHNGCCSADVAAAPHDDNTHHHQSRNHHNNASYATAANIETALHGGAAFESFYREAVDQVIAEFNFFCGTNNNNNTNSSSANPKGPLLTATVDLSHPSGILLHKTGTNGGGGQQHSHASQQQQARRGQPMAMTTTNAMSNRPIYPSTDAPRASDMSVLSRGSDSSNNNNTNGGMKGGKSAPPSSSSWSQNNNNSSSHHVNSHHNNSSSDAPAAGGRPSVFSTPPMFRGLPPHQQGGPY